MDTLLDTQSLNVLSEAGHALAAIDGAVRGGERADPTTTTVGSLADIRTVIANLVGEVKRLQADRERMGRHLARIANLELRGGTALIEAGEWKRVCEETQAIAESALYWR